MWKDKTHLDPRLYACFKDRTLIISIVFFATHPIQRFWEFRHNIFEKPLLCLIHTIWENILIQVLSCISFIYCVSSRSHSSSLDCTYKWISVCISCLLQWCLCLAFQSECFIILTSLSTDFSPVASMPISRRAFKFKHLGSRYTCFPKIPGFYEPRPSVQKTYPSLGLFSDSIPQ